MTSTLTGTRLTIEKNVTEEYDVDSLLSEIACLSLDIERFTQKRDTLQTLVNEARAKGYQTPEERQQNQGNEQ